MTRYLLRVHIRNQDICGQTAHVQVIGDHVVGNRILPKSLAFVFPKVDAPSELRSGIPTCETASFVEPLPNMTHVRDVKVSAYHGVAVSWEIDIDTESV